MKNVICLIVVLWLSNLTIQAQQNFPFLDSLQTKNYKVSGKKRKIPKKVRKALHIHMFNTAKPSGNVKVYRCIITSFYINFNKINRLNWIATSRDNKNHIVLSLTKGGKSTNTMYYVINCTNNKVKFSPILFKRGNDINYHMFLSFQEFVEMINENNFVFY